MFKLRSPMHAGITISTASGDIVLDENGEAIVEDDSLKECFTANPNFVVEAIGKTKGAKAAPVSAPIDPPLAAPEETTIVMESDPELAPIVETPEDSEVAFEAVPEATPESEPEGITEGESELDIAPLPAADALAEAAATFVPPPIDWGKSKRNKK